MCQGQDPPLSSVLLPSRQMFSVNNYYVATHMSSKKQVQRRGLILSTQHISVSTFNTYAGSPQSNEFICSCALHTCNNSRLPKETFTCLYIFYWIFDFLEGSCINIWLCVAHTHTADRMNKITKFLLRNHTFSLYLSTPSFPLEHTWCNSQISSLCVPRAHVNTATDVCSSARP